MNEIKIIPGIILVLLVVFSILSLFDPTRVMKGLSLWPRFLRRAFKSIPFSPKSEEALDLLINNQDLYIKKYGIQLQILRVTGFLGIIIAIVSLCRILG